MPFADEGANRTPTPPISSNKSDNSFIQQEKNKLPANILCMGIKDSNIEGLADNDRLEIAIDFATDLNQLTVINGNTMDCANITMTSLDAG